MEEANKTIQYITSWVEKNLSPKLHKYCNAHSSFCIFIPPSLPNTQDLMLLLQEKNLDSSQTPTKSTPLFTVLKK